MTSEILSNKNAQNDSDHPLSGFSDQDVLDCLIEEGMPSEESDNGFLLDSEHELHAVIKEP